MKTTVTIKDLFAGEMLGGMNPEEWERISMREKADNRLKYLEQRARALSGMPYKPEYGLPTSVWSTAYCLAEDAMKALESSDPDARGWLMLEVGRSLEKIKTYIAVSQALELQIDLLAPKSAGGKATAEKRIAEAQENQNKVAEYWHKLEAEKRPERERAGIIAQRLGFKIDTVRRLIKKAGLR